MNDAQPLPNEMILKPSRKKWFWVFLGGAVFCAGGIFLIREGEGLIGWLCLIFFGLTAVIAAIQLIGVGSYLSLTTDGFEQSMFGRKNSWQWQDVSDFRVWTIKQGFITTNSFVSFDARQDEGKAIADINVAISGGLSLIHI